MKKVRSALLNILPAFFVLGMAVGCANKSPSTIVEEEIGEDSAIYKTGPTHTRYDAPNIRSGDDDDEDPEVVVTKVILHYYNEGGGNDGRAFYLWVTGQDGVEYNFANASDIMELNEDGTMMTITLDFVNDSRFTAFNKKSKLFFIIKYKMISPTNLNWGGQSDDMQLVYADFPPKAGSETCEVWTMPAAGGGIAILDSENKTKVHGVQLAKFTDWKTINCELTKDTASVKWYLYAFDETYFKIKPKKREAAKKGYLVKSGEGRGTFNINLKYDAHINMVYSLESHDPSTDNDPDMKSLSKTVTVGYDKLYETAKFHTYYEDNAINIINNNKPLGVTYTPTATTFRVWSPVSANMTLLIYDKDTSAEFAKEEDVETANKYVGYHMYYTTGGIWEITIDDPNNELEGKYYNYQVDNTLGTNVTMDPYATSAGACGVRGYIYDKSKSNPEGWDDLPLVWDGKTEEKLDLVTPQDLSIYEVHMQDFTGDESWVSSKSTPTKRGTYDAFVESGTKLAGTSYTTGYDHLNELGVKAVQLLPVFDHDNDESGETLKYNWGYNPLNYNIPEGGYSSDPHNGMARVKEFKNLVLQMSKTDVHTRVIMDVVYNHVSSATGSCFHKLMPRYYFRYATMDHYYTDQETGKQIKYQSAGELWDGSGCHNEVASERRMMRKYIVDSLCMWAREYKVKGFRFDLMGLIDFRTMIAVKEALAEIDPDIYIYGEGWTSGGYHGEGSETWWKENPNAIDPQNWDSQSWTIYNKCNNFETNGVYLGGFNDSFRNAVRGENSGSWDNGKTYPGAGWIQNGNWKQGRDGSWYLDTGTLDSIGRGLWGINNNVDGHYPEQTVNYVSCHDNWTVRDQLFNTMPKRVYYNDQGEVIDEKPASAISILYGSLQAHALTFSSNSAAFIYGGEEFLRTKELNEDELDAVTADSYTELWGHYISHNSYNAPLRVNTFKWGNKQSITIHGETITDSEYHYNLRFKEIIQMHATSLKKRGLDISSSDFMKTTSANKHVDNIYWSEEGNFGNCVGFQANEYLIYTCSGNINVYGTDYILCDSAGLNSWDNKFMHGSCGHANGMYTFGETNSIAVYDRHGH